MQFMPTTVPLRLITGPNARHLLHYFYRQLYFDLADQGGGNLLVDYVVHLLAYIGRQTVRIAFHLGFFSVEGYAIMFVDFSLCLLCCVHTATVDQEAGWSICHFILSGLNGRSGVRMFLGESKKCTYGDN